MRRHWRDPIVVEAGEPKSGVACDEKKAKYAKPEPEKAKARSADNGDDKPGKIYLGPSEPGWQVWIRRKKLGVVSEMDEARRAIDTKQYEQIAWNALGYLSTNHWCITPELSGGCRDA